LDVDRAFGLRACVQVVDESEVLGCEVYHGACKLLYSGLQLHAPTRKAAQAIFLQVRHGALLTCLSELQAWKPEKPD